MINKNITFWKGKRIAVLGAGKTGISVSKLAHFVGAEVLLSESSKVPSNNIDSNIKLEVGGHSDKILSCDLIIKSPGIPNNIPILIEAKNCNIKIVSEIEFSSWFSSLPIIGLTGSNGKTTTVNLLYSIFKNAGLNPILGGNMGVPFSDNVIKELEDSEKIRFHILELSSFQLEHISSLSLQIACILNISEDHLDRYESYSEYIEAKLNIVNSLDQNGALVYNKDDQVLNKSFTKIKNKISFSYSDILDIGLDLDSLPLKGKHNYANIMAAIKISNFFNINYNVIKESVESFSPMAHRLEFIGKHNNSSIYNDSKATNIDAMLVALESFNQKVVLIVGGIDKGASDFKKPIKYYKNKIRFVACYGESGEFIESQIQNLVKTNYNYSFVDAVHNAVKNLKNGDCLLLSPGCASFDQFENYEDRGNRFKDIIVGLS